MSSNSKGIVTMSKKTKPVKAKPAKAVAKPVKGTSPKKVVERLKALKEADEKTSGKHIMVYAYAGTGKTFTQIMGSANAYLRSADWAEVQSILATRKNLDSTTFKVTPSDEQAAVWAAMKAMGKPRNIVYCAFNKSIVTEFGEQWGWLTDYMAKRDLYMKFSTVNALGHGSVYRAVGAITPAKDWTNEITAIVMQKDLYELKAHNGSLLSLVKELVRHCKLNMVGWDDKNGLDFDKIDDKALGAIIDHHGLEVHPDDEEQAFELVPKVIKESMNVQKYRHMTFDDQNWLPLVMGYPIERADLLMVDEAQDLPVSKQQFVVKAGRMLIAVGDVNQAIYGFAGADVNAMPNLESILDKLGGINRMKLTETRRCCQAVVREAQQEVPDFRAHADNPIGLVRSVSISKYRQEVNDLDMCLCRVNAPLVGQALAFIKEGRKVVVRGRDFGKSLIKFINDFKATEVGELIEAVEAWHIQAVQAENRKRHPSEATLMMLEDKKECVLTFCEGRTTVMDVVKQIDLVFTGLECPYCRKRYDENVEECYDCSKTRGSKVRLVKPKGILLSSIHKAKGLESNRVYLYRHKAAPIPSPMAKTKWAKVQEKNLLYIAKTRAINELIYVTD